MLAAVTMATVASPAHAVDGVVDPGGSTSAVSEGKVTFGSSPTVQCNVTLDMTFASV